MSTEPKQVVLKDRPMICVTFDYYNEPSELLVDEIYHCILEEVETWNKDKAHKDVIVSTNLYRDLAFGSPRYMLIMLFKEIADAATFMNSKVFADIRRMAINSKFNVSSNILAYDRGEEDDIGGG